MLIQPREEEEEEEEKNQIDANMIEVKMESFLSFRFRTYEEFIGKNGENLNEEETHYLHNQVSDEESDDEFFEVESNKEDETIIANSVHNSLHVEEIEESQISSEIDHGNNSVSLEGIEEPQINSEILGSADNSVNVEKTEEHTPEINSEAENSQINVVSDPIVCDVGENLEEEKVENEEKLCDSVKDSEKNAHFLSSDDDDESLVSDSDSDSMVSSSKFSLRSSVIDSISDGFLSDIDFERAFEVDTSME